MAVFYVTEFESITPTTEGGAAQQARQTPVAEQTLTITTGSVSSVGFQTRTKFVRLHTDAICSVLFGAAPVVATTNMRMAANQTEYFGVTPGFKVAVIVNT